MSNPIVTLSNTESVSVISIDDGKANVLSFDMLEQLNAALSQAISSEGAIAIIGREGKFSAGFDLSAMTSSVDNARRLLREGADFALRIFECPLPVVLGVSGHALAMGGILTTCADYRVGLAGAFKLGLNEVQIGMPVPRFAVELCRDRLAHRWFTRSVQHGHYCNPEEAVDAGFVDELADTFSDLSARTIAVASQIGTSVHSKAFSVTRANVRGGLANRLRADLEADMALFEVG